MRAPILDSGTKDLMQIYTEGFVQKHINPTKPVKVFTESTQAEQELKPILENIDEHNPVLKYQKTDIRQRMATYIFEKSVFITNKFIDGKSVPVNIEAVITALVPVNISHPQQQTIKLFSESGKLANVAKLEVRIKNLNNRDFEIPFIFQK